MNGERFGSDTSFTGRTHPATVGSSTVNPLTSNREAITLIIRTNAKSWNFLSINNRKGSYIF